MQNEKLTYEQKLQEQKRKNKIFSAADVRDASSQIKICDIESEKGLGRLHPGGHDRLEREAIEFHHKVRHGYLELVKKEPERWQIIDATKALSAVQEDLKRLIMEHCQGKFDLSCLV